MLAPPDATMRLAPPLLLWSVIFGGWLLLSFLLAPEVYLYFLAMGMPIPWRDTLVLTGTNAAIAAAFTPGIVWMTLRFPLGRERWFRGLLMHVPACLAFSVMHSWLYYTLCYTWHGTFEWLFARLQPNLLTYWAVVGLTEAVVYFRRYQARERELAQAELQLLRHQLHPHFLFNTLHTISAMMHEDVNGADRMMTRLSDLLRLTLDHIGHHEVRLCEEIEFVSKYLEIEQVRFEPALAFTADVPVPTLDALVPTMLLQPLVENAVRHGLGSGGGLVAIRARARDGRLELQVADNGRGLRPAGEVQARSRGLGLANLRRRLEQLYSDAASLTLANSPGGGAVATVELPLRFASVDAQANRENAG